MHSGWQLPMAAKDKKVMGTRHRGELCPPHGTECCQAGCTRVGEVDIWYHVQAALWAGAHPSAR